MNNASSGSSLSGQAVLQHLVLAAVEDAVNATYPTSSSATCQTEADPTATAAARASLRAELLSRVVLSGGTAAMPGMADRLTHEIGREIERRGGAPAAVKARRDVPRGVCMAHERSRQPSLIWRVISL